MRPDPDDAEVRAFVLDCDLPTYSLIAEMIEAKFGPDRAWPMALIKAVRTIKVRPGPRRQFLDNPVLAAFIADRADLATLDALLKQGQAMFGRDGFPSRSQLHRLIQESRVEARLAAAAITGRESP